jgi:beta-aspartyl-peptidase (threonine type)
MAMIAMAVHGGAGPDSEYIRENARGYKEGLKAAIIKGHEVLEKKGNAVDAVEGALRSLEDNDLFNAGRGSAINCKGEVEMDASVMDGKSFKAGAVSMITNVKDPVSLTKVIMNKTAHVLLSNHGALEPARDMDIELEAEAYFITPHQYNEYIKSRDKESLQDLLKKRIHGTVGAVFLDKFGNLAAATSTRGTTNSLSGRIGDSCLIGAGCYANNNTCAVSGTGDGEFLISGVIAHSISAAMEYAHCTVQEACDLIIHKKNKDTEGDIGVISVDAKGNFGISFNSERMHRAWMSSNEKLQVKIFKD